MQRHQREGNVPLTSTSQTVLIKALCCRGVKASAWEAGGGRFESGAENILPFRSCLTAVTQKEVAGSASRSIVSYPGGAIRQFESD